MRSWTRWRGMTLSRVLAASAALSGLSFIAVGSSPAGAVTSASWTEYHTPFYLPDSSANQFAADAMGNVYYVDDSTGDLMSWHLGAGSSTLVSAGSYYYYNGFTVDSQGNSYLSIGSSVIEVSPMGMQTTVTTAIATPGALAVDSAGHVYVVDNSTSPYVIDEIVNGSPVSVGSVATRPNSISVGSDGTVYAADYNSTVYKVAGGTTTTVGSGWNDPETVAVDGAGIVYVADEGLGATQVTPDGVMTDVTPTSSAAYCAEQVFVGGSTLYYADECFGSDTIYTTPVTALQQLAGRPTGLSVTSALGGAGTAPTQTVTARWLSSAGATSYTCTLLYGYHVPSSFKVSTTSTSCSFGGLSPTTSFGISVVAWSGTVASAPNVGFASAPAWLTSAGTTKHSVLCQKNHSSNTKWITNANPRCPSGWHRKLLL